MSYTCPEKFIRDNVVALFLLYFPLSFVILPFRVHQFELLSRVKPPLVVFNVVVRLNNIKLFLIYFTFFDRSAVAVNSCKNDSMDCSTPIKIIQRATCTIARRYDMFNVCCTRICLHVICELICLPAVKKSCWILMWCYYVLRCTWQHNLVASEL